MKTLVLIIAGFVVAGYLVHRLLQACDRANRVDWGSLWMNRLDGFNRLFCRTLHHLDTTPIELPATGGALVAANHVSGLDPLLLHAAANRRLHFIIAREEYERFGLRWLYRAARCIPVERTTRPERALRAALRSLEEGHIVALFPHGKIHLDSDPAIRLKRGVEFLARRTGCPIYPLHIEGPRAQGRVFLPVFLPSRSRVRTYPPLVCDDSTEPDAILAQLADLIEGRSP